MSEINEKNPLGLPERIEGLDAFQESFRRSLHLVDSDPAVRAAVGKTKVGNPISTEIVPSADRWAGKQIANSLNAGQAWVEGVQRPSRDFKEAAVAAAGKHKTKTMEALNDDRYRKGMAKVNVDEAIATAVAVGAGGYTSGIQARTAKINRVVTELQPKVAALKRNLDAMPQENDQQREAKMLAAKRGMQDIGKSRRG